MNGAYVKKRHLIFECFRFYFWKEKNRENINKSIQIQKHLTLSKQNEQRLGLACKRYNAYCCICMYVPVCVVRYDFFKFLFYSVGIFYFSI